MKIEPDRIEVPREEIDRVRREYGCQEPEAINAVLKARMAADTAYADSIASTLGLADGEAPPDVKLYLPSQIKERLDRYVIGQEDYKKRLSIAASYHFALTCALKSGLDARGERLKSVGAVRRFRKKNTMVAGPSGSGKTYCAEILGDFLETPTLIVDSTDYTEVGYVGKSADDMVRELIQLAPGSTKEAKADYVNFNGGIVFIDEIDKKAKDGRAIGHDVAREGFQRAVLKLIERKTVSIEDPMSPAGQLREFIDRQRPSSDPNARARPKGMVSTENILFILGGSFARANENLESIIRKRLDSGSRRAALDGSITVTGFTPTPLDHDGIGSRDFYRFAEARDYIDFGLIPELVGRAPMRTYANLISKSDLIRIMTETDDSVIEQYRLEFALFGIDLSFDRSAIEWIAAKAENQQTGARALVSVFETLLTDFQYELPGSNFTELKITAETCSAPRDALLTMLERSPFVEFAGKIKRDHGIDIEFDKKTEEIFLEMARASGAQVATLIESKLAGIDALKFMDWKGVFRVTPQVARDPEYFARLFVEWRQARSSGAASGESLP